MIAAEKAEFRKRWGDDVKDRVRIRLKYYLNQGLGKAESGGGVS